MQDDVYRENHEQQKRPLLRLFLLVPPALLLLSSAALLLSSPFAWGAASAAHVADWAPPLVGGLVGLAGLALSGNTMREVLRRSRTDYVVFEFQLGAGIVMFVIGSIMMLTVAFSITQSGTYEALIIDGEDHITAGQFLASNLFGAVVNLGIVWAAAWLYGLAITNQAPNRITRRAAGEVDAIGELIKERNAE